MVRIFIKWITTLACSVVMTNGFSHFNNWARNSRLVWAGTGQYRADDCGLIMMMIDYDIPQCSCDPVLLLLLIIIQQLLLLLLLLLLLIMIFPVVDVIQFLLTLWSDSLVVYIYNIQRPTVHLLLHLLPLLLLCTTISAAHQPAS